MRNLSKVKRSVALFAASVVITSVSSQKLSLYGEIRPRSEYREGYGKPVADTRDAAFFIQQRSRLGASFSNSITKMQVTLQDSRTWGDAGHNQDLPTTGIYEAWAEMLLSPGLTAKVGRQPLGYDQRRLFSPANWSNTGNSFDMLQLKYNYNNDFRAEIGVSYSNNSGISTEIYYIPAMKFRFMGVAWFSKRISDPLTLSVIGVVISNQDTVSCGGFSAYRKHDLYHNFTAGGSLNYSPKSFPLSLVVEAFFQSGKYAGNSSLEKLGGCYLAADASLALTPFVDLKGGYEYISGDDDSSDGRQKDFKHLFRGNHSFNGSMDYWNSTGKYGLNDIYAGLLGKFNKKQSSVDLTYHIFSAAKDNSALDGKSLGTELDFTFKHKVSPWFSIEAGYSYFFVNENVRITKSQAGKNTEPAQWAYLSISVKPSVMVELMKK